MHEAALQACGWAGSYRLVECEAEELALHVEALRRGDADGWNVTLPHKAAACELADERSPEAEEIGAANVLLRTKDGAVRAENTDVHGVRVSLDVLGVEPGGTALVLGAGGAARAAAWALSHVADRVVVMNRHVARARDLAADLVAAEGAGPASVSAPPWPRHQADRRALVDELDTCRVLVHATSDAEGKDPIWSSFPWESLPATACALDLRYAVGGTWFGQRTRAAGLRTGEGGTMLLHQAARAFSLWTGREAPIDAMAAALAHSLGVSRASLGAD